MHVGSGRHKCYPHGMSLPKMHIKQLICIFVLIVQQTQIPEFYTGQSDETQQVGSGALKHYSYVLLLLMYILSTSFAYLFRLANNNKVKYPKFYTGYGMLVVVHYTQIRRQQKFPLFRQRRYHIRHCWGSSYSFRVSLPHTNRIQVHNKIDLSRHENFPVFPDFRVFFLKICGL